MSDAERMKPRLSGCLGLGVEELMTVCPKVNHGIGQLFLYLSEIIDAQEVLNVVIRCGQETTARESWQCRFHQ
jgi:hypothetical protein